MTRPDYAKIARLEKELGLGLTVARDGWGINPNDLLVELRDLGLTDGVPTTVETDGTVTVVAGSLTANASTLATALHDLRDQVLSLPKDERPKAHESTTRTIATHDVGEDGERVVRPLEAGDL